MNSLALQNDAIAFDLHAVHAEVAQRGFVGEPENVSLVAQAFLEQILVNVDDVLESRALTGCAGVTCADDDFDLFALFHAFAQGEIGIAGFDRMRRGTNRMGESVFGPSPGVPAKFSRGPGAMTR